MSSASYENAPMDALRNADDFDAPFNDDRRGVRCGSNGAFIESPIKFSRVGMIEIDALLLRRLIDARRYCGEGSPICWTFGSSGAASP
mmetsp:Transcript_58752/g.67687  ORF Transcript_58752/g.67687 Transcript_58752/m.67687 type:complete len:88 (+) Transcript_58752:591-854(+)